MIGVRIKPLWWYSELGRRYSPHSHVMSWNVMLCGTFGQ